MVMHELPVKDIQHPRRTCGVDRHVAYEEDGGTAAFVVQSSTRGAL